LAPKILGGEVKNKSSFFRSFFSALEKERTPPGGHGRSESDWISASLLLSSASQNPIKKAAPSGGLPYFFN